MGEKILLCQNICPLPQGRADKFQVIGTWGAIRERKLTEDNSVVIGNTSVTLSRDQGPQPLSIEEMNKIATDGIFVPNFSPACEGMASCFNFVSKRKKSMSGTIKCRYTISVGWGSGGVSALSSQGRDKKQTLIEL